MLTVIAYDIANDRRRDKISTFLEDHGRRVNYSVFECELERDEFDQLHAQLAEMINARKDQVLFYRLCEGCRVHKTRLGAEVKDRLKKRVVIV